MLFESIKERDEKLEIAEQDTALELTAEVVALHERRDRLIEIAQGASPVSRSALIRDPDVGDVIFEQLDARDAGENPPETAKTRKLRAQLAKIREDRRNLKLHIVRNASLEDLIEAIENGGEGPQIHATDPEVYAEVLDAITERNTEQLLDPSKRPEREPMTFSSRPKQRSSIPFGKRPTPKPPAGA